MVMVRHHKDTHADTHQLQPALPSFAGIPRCQLTFALVLSSLVHRYRVTSCYTASTTVADSSTRTVSDANGGMTQS